MTADLDFGGGIRRVQQRQRGGHQGLDPHVVADQRRLARGEPQEPAHPAPFDHGPDRAGDEGVDLLWLDTPNRPVVRDLDVAAAVTITGARPIVFVGRNLELRAAGTLVARAVADQPGPGGAGSGSAPGAGAAGDAGKHPGAPAGTGGTAEPDAVFVGGSGGDAIPEFLPPAAQLPLGLGRHVVRTVVEAVITQIGGEQRAGLELGLPVLLCGGSHLFSCSHESTSCRTTPTGSTGPSQPVRLRQSPRDRIHRRDPPGVRCRPARSACRPAARAPRGAVRVRVDL